MQNRRFSMLVLVFFILSMVMGGCAAARKPAPTDDPIPNRTRADQTETQKARSITNEINKIDGVEKATVVVAGSKAYVGLDLARGIKGDEEQVHEVENIVADRIKGTEDTMETVYVSSDPEIVSRVKKVARGIARGDSVTRYAGELSDMGERIKPRNI